MSHVTSAVIFVSWHGEVDRQQPNPLLEPLPFDSRGQAFRELDDSAGGGYKALQATVYAAGLNYVDPEKLEEWFLALPWGRLGGAVLVYDEEGDYRKVVSVNFDARIEEDKRGHHRTPEGREVFG